jgi:hypothetical protein
MRTKWTSELGHGVVATVESWARMIREEVGARPPAELLTFGRELRTIRFHWDHVMAAPWLDEFAREMRETLRSLVNAGRLTERVLRVGPCPHVLGYEHNDLDVPVIDSDGQLIPIRCGETLRVRASAEEIRCKACGTVWPRSQWWRLGDQWADYALLAHDIGVPVTTLRRWASEDEKAGQPWGKERRGRRNLVSRVDALAAAKRRGKKVA